MTETEKMLAALAILMFAACGLIYYRTRSAWAVGITVALFMAAAYKLDLLA